VGPSVNARFTPLCDRWRARTERDSLVWVKTDKVSRITSLVARQMNPCSRRRRLMATPLRPFASAMFR